MSPRAPGGGPLEVAKPASVAAAGESARLPEAPVPADAAEEAGTPAPWSFDQQPHVQPTFPPCPADGAISPGGTARTGVNAPPPLCAKPNTISSVVDQEQFTPLSSEQKGTLAAREVVDPFNLITLTGQAGISIAANSHSPYGPGLKGFGRLTGYALLGDATGAFFGVYAVPSLTHEDPRYRRMQNASIKRRVLHAVAHTFVAESDSGRLMPNYSTYLTYPITAEIANLYVPGVQDNAVSTARRIALGIATDPISNLIAEFLPDLARHIHLRSVFFQQIVNQVALGTGPG